MGWQDIFIDTRINSVAQDINGLKIIRKIYEHLNPEEVNKWNALCLEFSKTTNPEKRKELLNKIESTDYFKNVELDIQKAKLDLDLLKSGRTWRLFKLRGN